MSRLEVSNHTLLSRLIHTGRANAEADRHRALILLEAIPHGALGTFAAAHELPFVGAEHASDRADRITQVLGSEFDILIHETRDDVDAGLLAALAGTVKSGGALVLGLPFLHQNNHAISSISPFNQRFARLLGDMQLQFPGKVVSLERAPGLDSLAEVVRFKPPIISGRIRSEQSRSPQALSAPDKTTAHHEQETLLRKACHYLERHPRGCITITGRRGRGKSALLGRIASWLDQQQLTFAVTAARQSALSSVHRHSSGHNRFVAPADAHLSGCRALLVDEASSLPIALLERYLESHDHVIYCTTVEGYENAGRAFAIRFRQMLNLHPAPALWLEPQNPWRWDIGDPLEHLIDTLLMGGTRETGSNSVAVPCDSSLTDQQHWRTNSGELPPDCSIRLLDRAALALDEPLLRQVYGLLRDTHYQTGASDLRHLLDGPDLQLWILAHGEAVKAALLLVMEGGIDPGLHEAIVSKQRRLPHQLLPQLLAQSANQTQGLDAIYGRVIRIAVAERDRRRHLGSQLLQAVEQAISAPLGPASGVGASFASDEVSMAFWQKNGYTRFHTGFKSNPRTGKKAVAVIKCHTPALESVVGIAACIHDDNTRWLDSESDKSDHSQRDGELLRRFALGQRSVHDTYAALSRLARQQYIPLHKTPSTSRRQYEVALRKAVKALLEPTNSSGPASE